MPPCACGGRRCARVARHSGTWDTRSEAPSSPDVTSEKSTSGGVTHSVRQRGESTESARYRPCWSCARCKWRCLPKTGEEPRHRRGPDRSTVAMAEPVRRENDRHDSARASRPRDRDRRGTSSSAATPLPSLLPRLAYPLVACQGRTRIARGRTARARSRCRLASGRWPSPRLHSLRRVASRRSRPTSVLSRVLLEVTTDDDLHIPPSTSTSRSRPTTSAKLAGPRRTPEPVGSSQARDPVMANDNRRAA